jgi:hypothetical protein
MMNLNLSNETPETRALRTKMEATERKIRLLDTVMGTLVSGLVLVAVIVLPILAH